MRKKLHILLGSCGGLTGLYIAKYIRRNSLLLFENYDVRIFGTDVSPYVPTKKFLDKLILLPPSQSKEFLSSLINVLNDYEIDLYIPTHSKEIREVSKNEEEIRNHTKSKFLVSPFSTFKSLDDKLEAYKLLSNIGINTPKIFKSVEEINEYPVLVKPRISSGSKGISMIDNPEELEHIFEKSSDVIVMEYLKGSEYTVDTFFDKEGRLITYNQRIRLKTLGGAAVITKNDFSIDVKNDLELIASNFVIKGPANFQFFYTNDGRKVFTDFNLRFPSGGLPLSVESGADIVRLLIMEILDLDYDPGEYQSDRRPRIMYRYFEEWYEIHK